MAFRMTVKSRIRVSDELKKVRDPTFWRFGANEWWKLISPYTPMDTGALFESVNIRGDEGSGSVEYKQPYAHRMYNGQRMHFRKDKHPLASAEWDKAAEPSQKPRLIQSMQNYIDSGRLKLK